MEGESLGWTAREIHGEVGKKRPELQDTDPENKGKKMRGKARTEKHRARDREQGRDRARKKKRTGGRE